MKQCPLCKSEALVKERTGTIAEQLELVRCSACGFCWTERTEFVEGKITVTIKVVKHGSEYYKKNRHISN